MLYISRVKLGERTIEASAYTAYVLEREFKAPVLKVFIRHGTRGEQEFPVSLHEALQDLAYDELKAGHSDGENLAAVLELGLKPMALSAERMSQLWATVRRPSMEGNPPDLFRGNY